MRLGDLPDSVLSAVLSEACSGGHYDRATELGRNLPLLAVCRRWRRVALPVVYSGVFVRYGECRCRRPCTQAEAVVEDPGCATISTNLGLVASAGYAGAAGWADIRVRCRVSPLAALRDIIQQLRSIASKWDGVRSLEIVLSPESPPPAPPPDQADCGGDIEQLADALYTLMPRVRELVLGGAGGGGTPPVGALYGRLAALCAGRLQVLDSTCPVAVPDSVEFGRLRDVDTSCRLPCMRPDALETLALQDVPAHSSWWDAFSTNTRSRTIRFPRLRSLRLAYSADPSSEDDDDDDNSGVATRRRGPQRLCFPALDELHIRGGRGACRLLEQAELPQRVGAVFVSAAAEVLRSLADAGVAATRSVDLAIVEGAGSSDPAAVFASVNRILSRARGCRTLALYVYDSGLPVLPESIGCAALTELRVLAPTSIDTAVGLIQGLPRLAAMALHCVTPDSARLDLSVVVPETPGGGAPVAPLNAGLASLALTFDGCRRSP
ncbi:hypothetical protein H4R18_005739 [Coemansia javaensis]|uniref:F-box domain-containing protein n=1 Tax=Coemansia javaensis TaxID=2761396 RepID=A0A9W8H5F1_9FUNG|nr:hypothetical protein H4R18_005739 [Coemansia javaensis]